MSLITTNASGIIPILVKNTPAEGSWDQSKIYFYTGPSKTEVPAGLNQSQKVQEDKLISNTIYIYDNNSTIKQWIPAPQIFNNITQKTISNYVSISNLDISNYNLFTLQSNICYAGLGEKIAALLRQTKEIDKANGGQSKSNLENLAAIMDINSSTTYYVYAGPNITNNSGTWTIYPFGGSILYFCSWSTISNAEFKYQTLTINTDNLETQMSLLSNRCDSLESRLDEVEQNPNQFTDIQEELQTILTSYENLEKIITKENVQQVLEKQRQLLTYTDLSQVVSNDDIINNYEKLGIKCFGYIENQQLKTPISDLTDIAKLTIIRYPENVGGEVSIIILIDETTNTIYWYQGSQGNIPQKFDRKFNNQIFVNWLNLHQLITNNQVFSYSEQKSLETALDNGQYCYFETRVTTGNKILFKELENIPIGTTYINGAGVWVCKTHLLYNSGTYLLLVYDRYVKKLWYQTQLKNNFDSNKPWIDISSNQQNYKLETPLLCIKDDDGNRKFYTEIYKNIITKYNVPIASAIIGQWVEWAQLFEDYYAALYNSQKTYKYNDKVLWKPENADNSEYGYYISLQNNNINNQPDNKLYWRQDTNIKWYSNDTAKIYNRNDLMIYTKNNAIYVFIAKVNSLHGGKDLESDYFKNWYPITSNIGYDISWTEIEQMRKEYGVEFLNHSYFHRVPGDSRDGWDWNTYEQKPSSSYSPDYFGGVTDEIVKDWGPPTIANLMKDYKMMKNLMQQHGIYSDIFCSTGGSSKYPQSYEAVLGSGFKYYTGLVNGFNESIKGTYTNPYALRDFYYTSINTDRKNNQFYVFGKEGNRDNTLENQNTVKTKGVMLLNGIISAMDSLANNPQLAIYTIHTSSLNDWETFSLSPELRNELCIINNGNNATVGYYDRYTSSAQFATHILEEWVQYALSKGIRFSSWEGALNIWFNKLFLNPSLTLASNANYNIVIDNSADEGTGSGN